MKGDKSKMKYKMLHNAGVEVSQLAVGTWAIGGANYGPVNDDDSVAAIRKMLELGVNLIDTAPAYGDGYSERIVGRAIKGLPRDKFLISTKCTSIRLPSGGVAHDATYKNIMREIDRSLENLGTDYVDFYFIHWPDPETPLHETMAAMETLRKMGKIRFIGLSNHSVALTEEAMKWAKIDVFQPPYSLVERGAKELMEWGLARGIDSFTYGSIGSGILSGKYRTLPQMDPKDFRLGFYNYYTEPNFSKIQELLKVMDKIAEKHDATDAQVAINWVRSHDFAGTALVGVKNVKQAEDNCAALNWDLDAEDMAMLDEALAVMGPLEYGSSRIQNSHKK